MQDENVEVIIVSELDRSTTLILCQVSSGFIKKSDQENERNRERTREDGRECDHILNHEKTITVKYIDPSCKKVDIYMHLHLTNRGEGVVTGS